MTSPTVLLNLYPANVTVLAEPGNPPETHRSVRVTVTPQKATIWGLVDGQPAAIAEGPTESFERPKTRRRGLDPDYTVLTAYSETWEIRKAGGCGCGSKLKSFNPFGGARRAG